ncbi:MAG TPA: putative glycolipid-binding domain-containing protein, partial [Ktedonobacteraceae bacterium]|nr:putative glycolipid-binding domain-containing protein [Ktedonobacteraceae bacterium]
RRLSLHSGQSTEILVACITIPTMEVQPVKQRYTCLERSDDSSLYQYKEVDSDFTTEIRVDAQGLVLDYPEKWKRAWDDSFVGIKTAEN